METRTIDTNYNMETHLSTQTINKVKKAIEQPNWLTSWIYHQNHWTILQHHLYQPRKFNFLYGDSATNITGMYLLYKYYLRSCISNMAETVKYYFYINATA